MPPLNVLIKPASGCCNMRCGYCFYADEMNLREKPNHGIMRPEVMQTVICKSLEHASGSCTFGFQGGEPTLAGLEFFQQFTALVRQQAPSELNIHYAFQTNGLLLNDEWASFFRDNNFLVGLSLDGPPDIHNNMRRDATGKDTYARVLGAAHLLAGANVQFNILTVVTSGTTRHIAKIYRFFRKQGFLWQQYIPCLDPFGTPQGSCPYSLTADAYGDFLIRLFDLWARDILAGEFIYIRYFENLAGMMLGQPPENCGMAGRCSIQNVVEADGSVYPCDFYMMDPYRIGNLMTDSFEDIRTNEEQLGFIASSAKVEEQCKVCQWFPLCRGGCRRDRQGAGDLDIVPNYYCSAFKRFFAHAVPVLTRILHHKLRR